MSENYLKHYEMELIILSPVYIGSGEKIGKKEYIFLWKNILTFLLRELEDVVNQFYYIK